MARREKAFLQSQLYFSAAKFGSLKSVAFIICLPCHQDEFFVCNIKGGNYCSRAKIRSRFSPTVLFSIYLLTKLWAFSFVVRMRTVTGIVVPSNGSGECEALRVCRQCFATLRADPTTVRPSQSPYRFQVSDKWHWMRVYWK